MPDIKGFNARAAQLRPGPCPVYGLTLATVQDFLTDWIATYGPGGVLAITWARDAQGHHVPCLVPQGPPAEEEK